MHGAGQFRGYTGTPQTCRFGRKTDDSLLELEVNDICPPQSLKLKTKHDKTPIQYGLYIVYTTHFQ